MVKWVAAPELRTSLRSQTCFDKLVLALLRGIDP